LGFTANIMPATQPVTQSQIIARGLRFQCPNCGAPLRFGRWMSLQPACPKCGARWDRGNGFFLGAMVWNYGVTVFGLIAPVALAFIRGWLSLPVAMGLGLAIGLLFPWIFYKSSWSLWLTCYYFFLPDELPANADPQHPELPE
jgi:uncharacterized protein (DUF983 family)